MGFFTDAYDLFVIGIASTLIAKDWNLSSGELALLNSTMLFAAFLGACVLGRFADRGGRKRVYWLVAVIMIVAALGSALAPSYWVLIGFRFLLGFGVGGDYPVSAVMVSEYANRKDRGKLVGMVFGTQALGLIVGPLVALSLPAPCLADALAAVDDPEQQARLFDLLKSPIAKVAQFGIAEATGTGLLRASAR